jgi:hypothetical protein
MDMDIKHDVKGNLMMKIVLEKLKPTRMLIPCVGELGSWYEIL